MYFSPDPLIIFRMKNKHSQNDFLKYKKTLDVLIYCVKNVVSDLDFKTFGYIKIKIVLNWIFGCYFMSLMSYTVIYSSRKWPILPPPWKVFFTNSPPPTSLEFPFQGVFWCPPPPWTFQIFKRFLFTYTMFYQKVFLFEA